MQDRRKESQAMLGRNYPSAERCFKMVLLPRRSSDCCVWVGVGRSATRQPHPRDFLPHRLLQDDGLTSDALRIYFVLLLNTTSRRARLLGESLQFTASPRRPIIEKPLRQLILLVLVTSTPVVQVLCPKYRLHINYAFITLASFLCLLISDHS